MKGQYHVMVQNNRIRYEFDIKRNITIIRGDSATGKTTLYSMIALAARLGDSSGIEVRCEEDSNSGYDFFHSVCDEHHIACKSADGKSRYNTP